MAGIDHDQGTPILSLRRMLRAMRGTGCRRSLPGKEQTGGHSGATQHVAAAEHDRNYHVSFRKSYSSLLKLD
ncbi:hypothetical protein [Rhodopila globiformis]|uniref:hypothetical protein n=1 Tax=Rhodopila globiformis TaxID=1071 RepID=UPI0013048D86|nr:hypothetical protein [Rhodopila globiformis]